MIMSNSRNVLIQVSFIGDIAKKAACSEVGFGQVHDLVDVVHRLEVEFPFLRKLKYCINVNAQLVERNRSLSFGDKVEIRPV